MGKRPGTSDMAEEDEQSKMTLVEHLEELRHRILYAMLGLVAAMVLAAFFGKDIIAVLKSSYVEVMQSLDMKPELVILKVSSAFIMYFRVVLLGGLILASPWVFYQLWMFVSAGLYAREKRYVTYAVPFSVTLFVGGALFFLLVVSRPMLYFFLGFSRWLGTRPNITLENHIAFMTRMMVVFGLGFQTPLVVLVLAKIGLVSTRTLNRYRKHVIVAMLILAALFTSPSPVDQVLLAIPMWLLYELGVLLVYLLVTRKAEPDDEYD